MSGTRTTLVPNHSADFAFDREARPPPSGLRTPSSAAKRSCELLQQARAPASPLPAIPGASNAIGVVGIKVLGRFEREQAGIRSDLAELTSVSASRSKWSGPSSAVRPLLAGRLPRCRRAAPSFGASMGPRTAARARTRSRPSRRSARARVGQGGRRGPTSGDVGDRCGTRWRRDQRLSRWLRMRWLQAADRRQRCPG